MKPSLIQTRNYPILLSPQIGDLLDEFLEDKDYASFFILMDENIMEHCWPILAKDSQRLKNAELIVIEPGEEQKDIEIAIQLWQTLTEYHADRSSLLINFGGGVISDLGGFIASTFKRGIDFINIPTSLLAMIDASVGGKTGINLQHFKNQVGVFNEPQAIFIQTSFLTTLDSRQLVNGYAEMLKHGLIADSKHYEEVIQIHEVTAENIQTFIEKSIRIKKDIVQQDPLEKGIRKSLNFGHTMGHILESWSLNHDEHPLLHGEAIAIGIILESYLSMSHGLSKDQFELIKNHINQLFPKYQLSDELINNFEEYLNQDKKKKGKKYNFTFVPKIGSHIINQNCSLQEIRESLIYYKEHCSCLI